MAEEIIEFHIDSPLLETEMKRFNLTVHPEFTNFSEYDLIPKLNE